MATPQGIGILHSADGRSELADADLVTNDIGTALAPPGVDAAAMRRVRGTAA